MDQSIFTFLKSYQIRMPQAYIVSEKRKVLISSLKSGTFIIMAETIKIYEIRVVKKVLKNLFKLPENIRERFTALAEQLRERGPVAHDWPNYSKLGDSRYHCHLTRSYVACWTHEKGTITIEVYYVGSRENAPY